MLPPKMRLRPTLCSVGTASREHQRVNYAYGRAGLNGGTTASCSAPRLFAGAGPGMGGTIECIASVPHWRHHRFARRACGWVPDAEHGRDAVARRQASASTSFHYRCSLRQLHGNGCVCSRARLSATPAGQLATTHSVSQRLAQFVRCWYLAVTTFTSSYIVGI